MDAVNFDVELAATSSGGSMCLKLKVLEQAMLYRGLAGHFRC